MMNKYVDGILDAYGGYFNYLLNEIINPSWTSYFYWLLLVSLFFFVLEWLRPWRQNQPLFRKDFWLDFFYMFFNFFLFSLIIYNAASYVVVELFNDVIIGVTGWDLQASNPMRYWPMWAILITGFLVRDFVQWNVHRLLHRSKRLWEFHKVHHSVEQMGFAAHLRYHWMETIVYRSIEYIPLALLGIGLYDFFIIHIFTLAVGHYNHSNISVSGKITGGFIGIFLGIGFAFGLADLPQLTVPYLEAVGVILAFCIIGVVVLGPLMKIIFNSPEMHIWHHAEHLPEDRQYGVNYGITLALWDYLFNTAYIPHSGRDIKLGFEGVEAFPKTFGEQAKHGFKINN
jgi:sterol desaturase/sphingolipid hydroxylase (fatty acid hydroxylase superfamily)